MNLRKYLSTMRDYDSDDVLKLMGLRKHSTGDWIFPMLAGLGAGVAIGAGIAVFLTPYKGQEAREKFMKSATDAQRLLSERVAQLSEKVQGLSGGEATGTISSKAGIGASTTGSSANANRTY